VQKKDILQEFQPAKRGKEIKIIKGKLGKDI
jgi:hypothetical protein